MTTATDLHNRAMRFADEAARVADPCAARDRYALAFALEHEALLAALARMGGQAGDRIDQPTHAVLHRSAAALAHKAGLPRTALALVRAGLAEQPPEELAGELREVQQAVAEEAAAALAGRLRATGAAWFVTVGVGADEVGDPLVYVYTKRQPARDAVPADVDGVPVRVEVVGRVRVEGGR